MSGADISTALIAAVKACANEAAGAEAPMVSITMEFVHDTASAISVAASVTRKTRTLVFIAAEARADGALVATAASVHKIRG